MNVNHARSRLIASSTGQLTSWATSIEASANRDESILAASATIEHWTIAITTSTAEQGSIETNSPTWVGTKSRPLDRCSFGQDYGWCWIPHVLEFFRSFFEGPVWLFRTFWWGWVVPIFWKRVSITILFFLRGLSRTASPFIPTTLTDCWSPFLLFYYFFYWHVNTSKKSKKKKEE